jgi:hypothetical protein
VIVSKNWGFENAKIALAWLSLSVKGLNDAGDPTANGTDTRSETLGIGNTGLIFGTQFAIHLRQVREGDLFDAAANFETQSAVTPVKWVAECITDPKVVINYFSICVILNILAVPFVSKTWKQNRTQKSLKY